MRKTGLIQGVLALCLPLPGVLLLGAALPACDWRSDGAARLEQEYPTPPAPVVDDTCAPPDDTTATPVSVHGACTRLASGHWAARFLQFGSINPAGMGPWNLLLADHFLATVNDAGALELTFCAQHSTLTDKHGNPVSLGATHLPDATAAALGAQKLVLDVPGAAAGRTQAWLWGVKDLADSVLDPLPTDAADPRVYDEDGDGHPGVTVTVQSPAGDRYMARRSRWSLGPATISFDSSYATGPLTFHVDENALGASIDLLKTVAPITPRSECASAWQLRCVPAAYTCADVLANASTLFLAPAP